MASTTVKVDGMTCGHCVQRVTDEVSKVPGVSNVVVDLASGNVTFDAEGDVSRDALAAAVEEAGFPLV